MRHTSSHTKNRRSHHALTEQNIVTDKETGNLRQSHRLDEKSGMYRGVHIVTKRVVAKKDKKGKSDKVAKAKVAPAAEKHVAKETTDKKSQGLFGRMITGKAKSRSGFGGGA